MCFCRIKGECLNSSARIEYYQTVNVMNTSFQLLKQLYMLCTVWIHFSSELTVFHIPGLNCADGHLRDLVWFCTCCSGIVHRSAIDIMLQNIMGSSNFTGTSKKNRKQMLFYERGNKEGSYSSVTQCKKVTCHTDVCTSFQQNPWFTWTAALTTAICANTFVLT